MKRTIWLLLPFIMCASPSFAIDAWQLVQDEVCNKPEVGTLQATQISFFEFQRDNGFNCASKALNALENEFAKSPQSILDSSRVLWSLYAATKDNSARDSSFRSITSKIRLSNNHPLRGEARLAHVRLSVFRGRPESDFFPQLDGILTDLNILHDPQGLSKLYSDGSTGLREALRWLYIARGKARAASGSEPLEFRLQSLAAWADQLAQLGAIEPELLQTIVGDAWSRGARLISPGEIPVLASNSALPTMAGTLDYSLCASGQCQQWTGITLVAVSDQLSEKKTALDVTDAFASIRYSIGSNSIIQGNCPIEGQKCTNEASEEAGKHYWLVANSAVTGGAAWKDSFWKKAKGIDDRYSEVSYKFTGTVNLPQCNDPTNCPVNMYAKATLTGAGKVEGATRSIQIKHPDGSKTSLSDDDLITLDRSAGKHEFTIELGLKHGEKGSTATTNSALAGLTLVSAAKLTKGHFNAAKTEIEALRPALSRYLPLILASKALLLRPAVIDNAPIYMGLGEALGQYSDSNPANRWDRVYLPLYFMSLIRNEVGPNLVPLERQEIELTSRVLSTVARSHFQKAIDQEIDLLIEIQPAMNVAIIDAAIAAIQKGESIDTTIDPLLAGIVGASTNSGLSGAAIAKAQELISKARLHDNLLDAVFLLYQARARLSLASELIVLRLKLLNIERTGYSSP